MKADENSKALPPAPPLRYDPQFLPQEEADQILADLLEQVAWEQHRVRLFGKWVDTPRRSAWYGDKGASYAYSGMRYEPHPWIPELAMLRKKVEAHSDTAFNSVLLNLYRDGSDSMGWHADDEPELGDTPVIASVSLGARRKLRFRLKSDHKVTHEAWLEHGSLLVMEAGTQSTWQHALPKTTRVDSPRVNLTFRLIRSAPAASR